MRPSDPIRTERLELVPASTALLAGDRGDRRELGRLLHAAIPSSWPPPLLDEATLAEFIRMENTGSDPHFRTWYWIATGGRGNDRILIGSGGTASCSGVPDTVMIGYSVLDEFSGKGYATEAVRHMIPVIFAYPGIRRILATTFPELRASIRILEKNGFVLEKNSGSGAGIGEGTLAFVLARPGSP